MAVKTITEAYDSTGTMYLKCEIDDGSVWTCNSDGTNWIKVRPTLTALEAGYAEAIAE